MRSITRGAQSNPEIIYDILLRHLLLPFLMWGVTSLLYGCPKLLSVDSSHINLIYNESQMRMTQRQGDREDVGNYSYHSYLPYSTGTLTYPSMAHLTNKGWPATFIAIETIATWKGLVPSRAKRTLMDSGQVHHIKKQKHGLLSLAIPEAILSDLSHILSLACEQKRWNFRIEDDKKSVWLAWVVEPWLGTAKKWRRDRWNLGRELAANG